MSIRYWNFLPGIFYKTCAISISLDASLFHTRTPTMVFRVGICVVYENVYSVFGTRCDRHNNVIIIIIIIIIIWIFWVNICYRNICPIVNRHIATCIHMFVHGCNRTLYNMYVLSYCINKKTVMCPITSQSSGSRYVLPSCTRNVERKLGVGEYHRRKASIFVLLS
jgi:hypothetical protein